MSPIAAKASPTAFLSQDIAETVSNIVLIGMNAGLRAARIGTGGRSLVVIAQELKLAAGKVADESRRLTPLFVQMHSASEGLRRADRLDAGHFTTLDLSMQRSLAAMRRSAERLGATLDRLVGEGETFRSVLGQARLGFSNAGAMSDAIAAAGHELFRSAAPIDALDDGVRAQVQALVQQDIWPSDTMVAERTIHTALLAECGFGAEAAGEMVVQSVPDDADACLF